MTRAKERYWAVVVTVGSDRAFAHLWGLAPPLFVTEAQAQEWIVQYRGIGSVPQELRDSAHPVPVTVTEAKP